MVNPIPNNPFRGAAAIYVKQDVHVFIKTLSAKRGKSIQDTLDWLLRRAYPMHLKKEEEPNGKP